MLFLNEQMITLKKKLATQRASPVKDAAKESRVSVRDKLLVRGNEPAVFRPAASVFQILFLANLFVTDLDQLFVHYVKIVI